MRTAACCHYTGVWSKESDGVLSVVALAFECFNAVPFFVLFEDSDRVQEFLFTPVSKGWSSFAVVVSFR